MTKGQSPTNRVKDSVFHLDKNDMTRPLQYGDVLVYQVGRMFCSRDNGIDEHVHPRLYELTCVTGGRGKVSANDEVTPVSAGDVFFSLPNERHRIESDSDDPLRFDFFAFYPLGGEEIVFSEIAASLRNRVVKNDRIPALVSTIIGERVGADEFSNEIIGCAVRQILLYLIRALKSKPTIVSDFSDREQLAFNILGYLDRSDAAVTGLGDLAEHFHFDSDYLNRIFREVTGMTLRRYTYLKRMQTACALMSEGKLTVSEIAERLNYASPAEFGKAFKNVYGCSPTRHSSYVKKNGV